MGNSPGRRKELVGEEGVTFYLLSLNLYFNLKLIISASDTI